MLARSMHSRPAAAAPAPRTAAVRASHCRPLQPRLPPPLRQLRRHLPEPCRSSAAPGAQSDAEPSDTDGWHDWPDHECCNACQQCTSEPNHPLRSICGWDAKGLPKHHTSTRGVTNQVQLSVYPDAIGANLAGLRELLNEQDLAGALGGVHLLPLYPSTGDRGFAPINYQLVDPAHGSWEDVHALAANYQLCLEFMPNHISAASPQFQDYVAHGANRDMFVHWRDVWPGGAPTAEQLAKIRTRKPSPPVIAVHLADGRVEPLWNTFSEQQIDINPFSAEGWAFVERSLTSLCRQGATLIRLDAFGYVTKRADTACFMQEPEVWELLDRIKAVVRPYNVQLLCEVHEDVGININLARHGFWVYDFALPLLVLHALRFKTAEPLKNWLSICPRRQITVLDTHDGMGVDDVSGLAPLVDVLELEKCITGNGGTVNWKHHFVPGGQFERDEGSQCKRSVACLEPVKEFLGPDCLQGCYKSVPHQYNETYFDACGADAQTYLLARAIQFFTPGVPMVYYVGLLAGRDDLAAVAQGDIRDINRHRFSVQEARAALRRPVVQALLQLCRLRNSHPAFQGRVFVDDSSPPHVLRVRWYTPEGAMAVLDADMCTRAFLIRTTPHDAAATADALGEEGVAAAAAGLGSVSSVFSLDGLDVSARQAARRRMAAVALAPGGNSGGGGGDGDRGSELQVLDLSWAWTQGPAEEEGRGGAAAAAAAEAQQAAAAAPSEAAAAERTPGRV